MSKSHNFHELIFVGGPPGVGKSTVAKEFTSLDSSSQQIGAGDLIRAVRAGEYDSKYESIVQKAAREEMLVPPEIFSGLLHERIQQADEGVSLSLIDGFPYSEADWWIFKDQMTETRTRLIGFIALHATLEVCVDRMAERGVRKGEQIRVMANEEPLNYYRRRYDEYSHKKELIRNIFLRSNVPMVDIDANNDARDVSTVFQTTVRQLREDANYER